MFLGCFQIIQKKTIACLFIFFIQFSGQRFIFRMNLIMITIGNHNLHFAQTADQPLIKSSADNNFSCVVFQNKLQQRILLMTACLNGVFPCTHFAQSNRISIFIVFHRSKINRLFFIRDFIHDCSRCNHTDDISFHKTRGFFRILYLFYDRHLESSGGKTSQIGSDSMMWNTAHRYFLIQSSTLSRQNKIQFL